MRTGRGRRGGLLAYVLETISPVTGSLCVPVLSEAIVRQRRGKTGGGREGLWRKAEDLRRISLCIHF